jgi:hypothetical protein
VNGIVLSGMAADAGHAVGALGVAEAPLAAVAGLRRGLGPPGKPPFPATFLKASEEQTILAVAAVARAVADFGLQGMPLTDWAVIGAPRSLGRLAAAEAMHKFAGGGALKVSPFIVPHRSLHAVSGTISQGFQIQGPNFGVGGHPGAVLEGLLAALTLLEERPPPGLWLVLSEYEPEPVPDREGICAHPVVCRALALAFRPGASGRELLRVRLLPPGGAGWPSTLAAGQPPTVAELIHFLGQEGDGPAARRTWSLDWGATLELTRAARILEAIGPAPIRHVA